MAKSIKRINKSTKKSFKKSIKKRNNKSIKKSIKKTNNKSIKRRSGKKRVQKGGKLNAYFKKMLHAKKNNVEEFEYNGKTYKQAVTKTGMVIYKSK